MIVRSIECDGCRFLSEDLGGKNDRSLIESARLAGWERISGRDYCPECAAIKSGNYDEFLKAQFEHRKRLRPDLYL